MRNNGHRELLGVSRQAIQLRDEIVRIARSDAKVLVMGESGVGKELVARAIHAQSLRAARPFVPVNCAGIPETLLESELFGHVKGSFTGAYRDKPGKLELADSGTAFLDEVGEMTLRMQSLLLRFLETGELQRVGTDRAHSTLDVRVIAATNRDLTQRIADGQFREDLFYRLNVIQLWVPPLRDRKEDVPLFLAHFLEQLAARTPGCVRGISPDACALLADYSWPGNVRELENVIERLVVTCRNEIAQVDDLPAEVRAQHRVGNGNGNGHERRDLADTLYRRLVDERESFWTAVYPLYMQREISRTNVRDLVGRALESARGNYKIVVRLFNMEPQDYKRFLNFLRKHDCQLPFKEYR